MNTKLVFVLTCSSSNNYIEQALIAVYSARYWNPDANILLITDNLTNQLLTGKRATIKNYLSDLIVVSFEDDKSMMYRSRWIKTSIRQLISGDFLYIDCDTVTTRCLEGIESFSCKMGAVPDSHLPVKQFCSQLMSATEADVSLLGIELEKEVYYFSSGVLFVRDTPETYAVYENWHSTWQLGVEKGINIDQPSLAKANIEADHLIERIDDKYNCVIYTQPDFAKEALILHFTAYRNPSWLFSKRVLEIIQKEGITDWLIPFILNPVSTYIPFRYSISRMSINELVRSIKTISKAAEVYSSYVDASFSDMNLPSRWQKKAKEFFMKKHFTLGGIACLLPTWISLKVKHTNAPVPNICAR
jgi:lipopolysaccharide biosynthesis glycosyltransferase